MLSRCFYALLALSATASAAAASPTACVDSRCRDAETETQGALLQIKQLPGQRQEAKTHSPESAAVEPVRRQEAPEPDARVPASGNASHASATLVSSVVQRLRPWCWQIVALVVSLLMAAALVGVLTRSEETHADAPGSLAEAPESLIVVLGNIWPNVFLAGAAAGILVPLCPYVSQNFFARSYTDLPFSEIHCESLPDSSFCVAAVDDSVAWTSRMGFVISALAVVLSPSLGVLSDSYGRRPVIVACQAIRMLPDIALGLHVYLNVSFYLWYALSALSGVNVLGCFFALVTDLVKQQEHRAAAFGCVLVAYETAMLTGMAIGRLLPLQAAMAVALMLLCMNLTYLALCLQETVPMQRRKQLDLKPLAPLASLTILLRSEGLQCLTFVFVISGFVRQGVETINIGYFQKYLSWSAAANYTSAILGQLSILVWIGVLLKPISQRCGEVGLLLASQLASAVYNICLCFVWDASQVFVAVALLCGTVSLSFPATAALKGAMVAEDEQGHVQGAVQAVKDGAEALGQLAFGALFNMCDNTHQRTSLSGVPFLIGAFLNVSSLPIIAWLYQSNLGTASVD